MNHQFTMANLSESYPPDIDYRGLGSCSTFLQSTRLHPVREREMQLSGRRARHVHGLLDFCEACRLFAAVEILL